VKIDPLKNNGYHGVKKRHGGRPDVKEWNDSHDTGKSRECGESAYAIGKELRISKNTARKYIECPLFCEQCQKVYYLALLKQYTIAFL
jgi:hypothetical protein